VRFKSEPFDLTFSHKEIETDKSDHQFSLIYSFRSSETKLRYILRAEYHSGNVFGIKFYAKNHALSDFKYSIVTNKGHSLRIYLTCASIVPKLLQDYPSASFGLIASRSIDSKKEKIEPVEFNRRFKIYSDIIQELFGE